MKRTLAAALALVVATPALADDNLYSSNKPPEMYVKPGDYNLQMKDFVFPSGLRVIMQADHSQPIVAITAVVDHGSTSDPVGKEGIAHFVEHLWFRSEHGDLPKVWDVLSELGCSLNASTAADWTNYMSVCPSTSFESLLKLESLRLTDPVRAVEQDVVDIEREVVRNELRMRYENTGFMALPYLFERLYPEGHPYQRLGIGSHGSLDNIELADIQKFTVDYYRPENTTIVIVGDFDPEYASDYLFKNFDPSLFHPKATEEHLQKYIRPGIENPDPENEAHFKYWLTDPDTGELLELGQPQPRIDPNEPAPEPPDPVDRTVGHIDAAVEYPTVFLAWTVPGSYRGLDGNINVAAGQIGSAMAGYFDRNYDHIVRQDPVDSFPFVSCFPWTGKVDTKVICSIEIVDDTKGEYIAEKALDQVSSLWTDTTTWTPEFRAIVEAGFNASKNSALAGILRNVEEFASLSGRATTTAEHAHYTGSAAYFSDQMNATMAVDMNQARDLAYKYLQRDRAVMLVAHPLPESERLENESGSDYHGASKADSVIEAATDPKSLTPEVISKTLVPPDIDRLQDYTLDNGMRVVLMPHGEAPLVTSTLLWGGGDYTDPDGLDYWTRTMTETVYNYSASESPEHDEGRIAGVWSLDYSPTHTWERLKHSSGNLDGALWLMRESIEKRIPDTGDRKRWMRRQHRGIRAAWRDADYWQGLQADQTLFPDHPFSKAHDWNEAPTMVKEHTPSVIRSYMARKYRPDNATLIVVGDIKVKETQELIEGYFGSWKGKDIPESEKIEPVMYKPVPPPDKGRLLLFDDPLNTQTQVAFQCRLADITPDNRAAAVLLGDMLDEKAWTILREQSGITYGAGAGTSLYAGNAAVLNMSSLIQNSGAVFGAETFYKLVEMTEKGELDDGRLRLLAWIRAKKYVLGQQTTESMAARLRATVRRGESWEDMAAWGTRLGEVEISDLAEIIKPCRESAVVTMIGPVKQIGPALEEAGMTYETIDWEQMRDDAFRTHDPKTYKKMLKAREKEAAKEAEEAANAGSDDSSEG